MPRTSALLFLAFAVGCAGESSPSKASFKVKDIATPHNAAERAARNEIVSNLDEILTTFHAKDAIKSITFEKYEHAPFADFFALAEAAKVPRAEIDSLKYRPESKDSITLVRVKGKVDEGGLEARPFDDVWEVRNNKTAKKVGEGGVDWVQKYLSNLRSQYPIETKDE